MVSWVGIYLLLLSIFGLHLNETSPSVINMITKTTLTSPWIEYGEGLGTDEQWIFIQSQLSSFVNPIVVISLPDNPTSGVTFISRIRNFICNGQVSFETRLFQPNSSYCSKEWHIPVPLGDTVPLRWLIAEQGAYNISNKLFFVHEANLNRPEEDPKPSIIDIDYPYGCINAAIVCRYPESAVVGVIAQLQTFVYDRMLIPRVAAAFRGYAKFILQPHDSIDSSYFVMKDPERVGFITFDLHQDTYCDENILLSTYASPATSNASLLSFRTPFQTFPGIFGIIGTTVGLADSTSLRIYSITKSSVFFLCQEDQCADEEMNHPNVETPFFFVIGEYLKPAQSSTDWTSCGIFFSPQLSTAPSTSPSSPPSSLPTLQPSTAPSFSPSCYPSFPPSSLPTCSPSNSPTHTPSSLPTILPSLSPSLMPSTSPSNSPTHTPSSFPTILPSLSPSLMPSTCPTLLPSLSPTSSPSISPSSLPSSTPSTPPSPCPSLSPTFHPTKKPSAQPSLSPTYEPSNFPSLTPSSFPTFFPSFSPTLLPSRHDKMEYYDAIDVGALLDMSPITGPLQFRFTAVKYSDFEAISARWNEFVNKFLMTPVEVVYPSIDLWSISILRGDSHLTELRSICSGSIVNPFMGQITSLHSAHELQLSCQESDHLETWRSAFGRICRGCSQSLISTCSSMDGRTILLPNNADCQQGNESFIEAKLAVVMVIHSQIKNKDSVPLISSISVTPAQSSVRALITFLPTSKLAGSVYCHSILTKSDLPRVRSNIRRNGQKTKLDGSSSISILIPDLIPSSNYELFCFTEDLFGNILSHVDFLESKIPFQTLCCVDILITGPPYVVISTSNIVYNQFRFDLRILPHEDDYDLRIETSILQSTSSNFLIQPSEYLFTPNNAHLGKLRTFLVIPLLSDDSNVANFTLTLTITGKGNEIYSHSSSRSFLVVSSSSLSNSLLPPPRLASGSFDRTGQSVTVCFDSKTDRAVMVLSERINAIWKCHELLSFPGDNYTACSWVNSQCLRIQFCGSGACERISRKQINLLQPGEQIFLRSNSLRSSCQLSRNSSLCLYSNYSSAHFVTTTLPATTLSFSPILKILQEPDGECQGDLIIDATSTLGNGGRLWNKVQWSVTVNETEPNFCPEKLSLLQDYLIKIKSIDLPVLIPSYLLFPSRFIFSLELLNYLSVRGVSSIDVNIQKSDTLSLSPSQYSLKFNPFTSQVVSRYQYFKTSVALLIPSCYNNRELQVLYEWRIYKDSYFQPSLQSVSRNPSVYLLPPYSLDSGAEYLFYVIANVTDGGFTMILNSSMTIQVDVGTVYVIIKGETARHVRRGSPQIIDASGSTYVDHFGTKFPIPIRWSCLITNIGIEMTHPSFGDSCDNLFLTNISMNISSLDLIMLDTNLMIPSVEYTFTASSSDVKDQIAVTVFESDRLNEVAIESTFKKFVSSKYLRLEGSVITSPGFVDCSLNLRWDAYDSVGEFVNIESYAVTPISRVYSPGNQSQYFFPLSLNQPILFLSGNSYSFKLSSNLMCGDHFDRSAFSLITLQANGPPSNGVLQVEPPTGSSLETHFAFNALYFVDDEEDYPFTYVFKYSLFPSRQNSSEIYPSVFLTSQISSPLISSVLLPCGLSVYDFQLDGSVIVSDFYSASIEVFSPITVFNKTEMNRSSSLELLNIAKSQININSLLQITNNLGVETQRIMCSYSPNCTALNRYPCLSVPHTCGFCLPGFIGALGESNGECVLESSLTVIGNRLKNTQFCLRDSDCYPDICTKGQCSAAVKACPRNPMNQNICSGHGACVLKNTVTGYVTSDPDGNNLNCSLVDLHCAPFCQCEVSFFGYDCSLNAHEYQELDEIKAAMCDSLSFLNQYLDDSEEKIQLLVSTLSVSLGIPTTNITTFLTSCLPVLTSLTDIINSGYLTLEYFPVPHQNILDIVSQASNTISFQNASFQNTSNFDPLRSMMTALVESIGDSLVGGERPTALLFNDLKVVIQKIQLNDLQSQHIVTPPNKIEKAYQKSGSSVTLPHTGLANCYHEENIDLIPPKHQFVTVSLEEWGVNPTLLGPTNNSMIPASKLVRFSVSGPRTSLSSNYPQNRDDFYQVTVNWATERNWNLDQFSVGCPVIIDDDFSDDLTCPCEVAYLTSTYVTYSCRDFDAMCHHRDTSSRYLGSGNREKLYGDMYHHPLYYPMSRSGGISRRLDFDYDASADDDNQQDTTSIKDYLATFKSIDSEFTNALGNTDFPISKALPLLVALSIFILLVACGTVLFSYWDEYDAQLLETGNTLSPFHKMPPSSTSTKEEKPEKIFDLNLVFMGRSFVKEKEAVALNHLRHMSSFREERGKGATHSVDNVTAGDRLKPKSRLDSYFANVDDCEEDFGLEYGASCDELGRPCSVVSMNSSFNFLHDQSLDRSESVGATKDEKRIEGLQQNGSESHKNELIFSREERRRQHDTMISLSARLKLSDCNGDSSSESAGSTNSSSSVEDDDSIHSISTFRSDILPTPKMRTKCASPPLAMSSATTKGFAHEPKSIISSFVKPLWERSTSSSTAKTMTTGSKFNPSLKQRGAPIPLIRKLSSIGTVDSIVSSFSGVKIFEIGNELSSFFDRALPPTSLLSEKNGWRRFLQSVLREHDWLRIISYSSKRLPRLIRFLVMITNILILFFVDSLFYGIFYPHNEICSRYSNHSMDECLSVPSKLLSDESQCLWNDNTSQCEMKSPPSSLEFYMIVSIIITSMSIFPQVLCNSILEDICSCQPTYFMTHFEEQDKAGVGRRVAEERKKGRRRSSTLGKTIRKYDIFQNNSALSEVMDIYSYYEHLSCEEETNMILTSVDYILKSTLEKISLPWKVTYLTDDQQAFHMQAIMEYLGIYPDGSPVPLTLVQKLFYGSTRKRIEWKINKVRKQSSIIVNKLMKYSNSSEDEDDCGTIDTALIQYFILEQLSPFHRYALKKEFFRFDNAQPETISFHSWFLGWLFMTFVWLFLLYFIFQWALVHSYLTLTAWSYQIMFVLIQDIFVNQLLQIFLIHVVIIEALRPQLRQIYFILNDIVVNKIQHKKSHDENMKKKKKKMEEKGEKESVEKEGEGTMSPFHLIRVCQHLSACCRAARVENLKYLPASQLLLRIDDHDIALCRGKGRGIKLGWIMSILIIIPAMLALADDTIQESVLDIALPTTWSCFLLANSYLYALSPFALILPYLFLCCGFLYRYFVILPSRRAVKLATQSNPIFRSSDGFSSSSLAKLSLFDQILYWILFSWEEYSKLLQFEKLIERNWRNMNLSIQLCEDHQEETTLMSTPHIKKMGDPKQEMKRLGSDLSDVLHAASLQSSKSFQMQSAATPLKISTDLEIPPEVLAMRNVKKQQKFIYRVAKGMNWSSRLINYLFWNLNTVSGDSLRLLDHHDCEDSDECSRRLTSETAEEVTADSVGRWSWIHTRKPNPFLEVERDSWTYGRCETAGSSTLGYRDEYEEEDVEEDLESEVFTVFSSESSSEDEEEDEEESWDVQFFDHYYDVDDSTMTY